MQTFLPYPDFQKSAQCLDMRRLGKQRVETLQIIQAIKLSGRWMNHPAAKMWSANVPSLIWYGLCVCEEWISRGYRDTCYEKIKAFACGDWWIDDSMQHPPAWFGQADFHAAHRSNLLRKDAAWYGQFGWQESADLPYVWPTP